MKKVIALVLAVLMIVSVAACSKKEETKKPAEDTTPAETTVGSTLLDVFKSTSGTAQEIADAILQHESIQFMPASMPITEGDFLTGFGETEIKGFKECVMFGPAIGTIPFIGYIFVMEDGADIDAFKSTLETSADKRWNICTEAEEVVVDSKDNTVFFLMCPKSFETPAEDGGVAGDMAVTGDMAAVGDMAVAE